MFLPPGFSGSASLELFILTFVESIRSAEPPIRAGILSANVFRTFPDACLVGRLPSFESNKGIEESHPSGRSLRCSHSMAKSGYSLDQALYIFFHSASRASPLGMAC